MYLLGQIIGVLGFAISIVGYFCEEDNKMKLVVGFAVILISVSFYLLGAYTGAAIGFINAIRFFISMHKKSRWMAIPFVIFYIIAGIYTCEDYIDLMPVCASLSGTYAVFYLSRTKLRYGMIVAASFWFCYDIAIGSIGAIMMDILTIAANAIFIFKSNRRARTVTRV